MRARYGALKSLGERKACFNEYLQQRKKDEKEEARQRCAPPGHQPTPPNLLRCPARSSFARPTDFSIP